MTLRALVSLFTLGGLAAQADDAVLSVARSYADGGGYNRKWSGSGSPEAITHDGRRVLAAGEGGTYCCGYTFAVAMKVAQQRGLLEGKSFDDVKRFQKLWYGATDADDKTLVVLAAETLGVGRGVPLEEAQPGDFVQLWRHGGSGHSVVLLGWVEEEGRKVGVRYRSSQGSTDGVGDAVEYFADAPGERGRVLRDETFACRLNGGASL